MNKKISRITAFAIQTIVIGSLSLPILGMAMGANSKHHHNGTPAAAVANEVYQHFKSFW